MRARRDRRLQRRPRRALAAVSLGLVWLVAAGPGAFAALPAPDRVLSAAAKRNRDAGRGQGLRLEVALYIAEPDSPPADADATGGEAEAPDATGAPPDAEEPVATGTLWSHPDGRVGLELEAKAGFVERHVLRGSVLRASRDGQPLESPRPFLPPFPLFQPRSSGALQATLRSLGVDPEQLGLGYDGANDCYVVGGRGAAAALWIDQVTLDPVRFDRADGVKWRLGPSVEAGEELSLPGAIEITAPGLPQARLVILGGAKAEALPGLDRAWLAFTQSGGEVR